MAKWLAILGVIKTIVTLGDILYVFLEPCKCGSREAGPMRLQRYCWIVFCPRCRIKTTSHRFKRQAKRDWNRDMMGIKE